MNRRLARVPEMKPITIGAYTLTSTGLKVKGRPTFAEHEGAGVFIKGAHKASGWWLADWLRYGESRSDWTDRLSQAEDATGLSRKTLMNVRAVGAIEESRRRDDVEFHIHAEVIGLPEADQVAWLDRAQVEGWDRRELRQNMRAARRARVLDGQAVLEGMYRVIYADPPWVYGDSGATVDGSLGKAERHYEGMAIADLCKLPVEAHALPDSVLFLWVTAPLLLQNPGPRDVLEAWGFTYKTNLVWDKVLGNYGHYVHGRHEHLIIGTRGSCLPDVPTPSPDSVYTERRSDVHSEKPDGIRRLIQQLYTRGPYLELFGRKQVEGWDVFGNDARLWAQEKATA